MDENIKCITANNGQRALEILKSPDYTLPDFIFLDLRMPRLSGKKCLHEIKGDERLKHIPVIIYTTSRNVDESKELRDMGAVYFMSKPNNADEIYYLITFAIEQQIIASQENT